MSRKNRKEVQMKTESRIVLGTVIITLAMLPVILMGQGAPAQGAPAQGAGDIGGNVGNTSREYMSVPPALPVEMHVRKTTFIRFPGIDEGRIMQFVADHFPHRLREYRKLSTTRPNQAVETLTDLVAEAIELMDTRTRNPSLFEHVMKKKDLEWLARRKAVEAKQREGEARDRAIDELEKILVQSFEVKQKLMQEDVAAIEKELGQLKRLIEKREDKRTAIISRRLTEMTGDGGYLNW